MNEMVKIAHDKFSGPKVSVVFNESENESFVADWSVWVPFLGENVEKTEERGQGNESGASFDVSAPSFKSEDNAVRHVLILFNGSRVLNPNLC